MFLEIYWGCVIRHTTRGVIGMFTREDFFDSILANKESNVENTIELLKIRGFFIELDDDGYFLSDNAHKEDVIFLNDVISRLHIGDCKDNKIFIYYPDNYRHLLKLFQEEVTRKSDDVCYFKKNWKRYKSDYFGEKVPVSNLEPFVAMYVMSVAVIK